MLPYMCAHIFLNDIYITAYSYTEWYTYVNMFNKWRVIFGKKKLPTTFFLEICVNLQCGTSLKLKMPRQSWWFIDFASKMWREPQPGETRAKLQIVAMFSLRAISCTVSLAYLLLLSV